MALGCVCKLLNHGLFAHDAEALSLVVPHDWLLSNAVLELPLESKKWLRTRGYGLEVTD